MADKECRRRSGQDKERSESGAGGNDHEKAHELVRLGKGFQTEATSISREASWNSSMPQPLPARAQVDKGPWEFAGLTQLMQKLHGLLVHT